MVGIDILFIIVFICENLNTFTILAVSWYIPDFNSVSTYYEMLLVKVNPMFSERSAFGDMLPIDFKR